MNQSFLATIAYGMLALTMLFLANLVGCIFGGKAYVAGVVLSILATGAAYVAQHFHTMTQMWWDQWIGNGVVQNPDAYQRSQRSHRRGMLAQYVSIAAAVGSGLCFVGGAW